MSYPIDQDAFDNILADIVEREFKACGPALIFDIPGVYELVSEFYTNDVLQEWSDRQADAAEDAYDRMREAS